MGKHGNQHFLLRFQEMIRSGVIEDWRQEFPDYSPSDLNFVYDFLFAGSIGSDTTATLRFVNSLRTGE